jgi:hypothetical protein
MTKAVLRWMIPLNQKSAHPKSTWATRKGEPCKDPYMLEHLHELQDFPHPTFLVIAVPSR